MGGAHCASVSELFFIAAITTFGILLGGVEDFIEQLRFSIDLTYGDFCSCAEYPSISRMSILS